MSIDNLVISLFGISDAGKTCAFRALVHDCNFDTVPTIGLGQEKASYLHVDQSIQVQLFDLGGATNFRSVWKRFYAELFGFIYIVDASNQENIQESIDIFQSMIKEQMLLKKPYVIVANKQDVSGALDKADIAKRFNVSEKIVFSSSVINSTNEKCDTGLEDALNFLIDLIIDNYSVVVKKRQKDMREQGQIEELERAEKLARVEQRRKAEETHEDRVKP